MSVNVARAIGIPVAALLAVVFAACSGSGNEESAVGAVPPNVLLQAAEASIPVGGTTTLTWNADNATSCIASDAWTGDRPVNGEEIVGPLAADSTFVLSCEGPGGTGSSSVQVATVTVIEVTGLVDSGLVDRWGENRVYVFDGDTAPDDIDGDAGDPRLTIPVVQQSNACTFSYVTEELEPGDYTLAFTNQAADDMPGTDDSIEFFGTVLATVANGVNEHGFDAPSVLTVGPGRQYQTVSDAAAAASDGDVVEIDAGLYTSDVAVWNQNNLTLRGVGGFAHLRADGADAQGKAIWVLAGDSTVVENIEFSGITVPDQNGAGIRLEGSNLAVCNSFFHDSDEGILGGAGDVVVEYSEFSNNGFGDGFSHNIYILGADRFTLRHSYVHHARVGHNVKSRARENFIFYNRIMDESGGNSSYLLDIPNGGLTLVLGNLFHQGFSTENSSMMNYGTEGLASGRTHHLYIVNNTLVDDYGGTFVQTQNGTPLVRMINNLFVGGGALLTGTTGSLSTNLQTNSPGLVDRAGYDYRPTSTSSARDAGSEPGVEDGLNLAPAFQYQHPGQREVRTANGAPDIGGYEFSP